MYSINKRWRPTPETMAQALGGAGGCIAECKRKKRVVILVWQKMTEYLFSPPIERENNYAQNNPYKKRKARWSGGRRNGLKTVDKPFCENSRARSFFVKPRGVRYTADVVPWIRPVVRPDRNHRALRLIPRGCGERPGEM